MNSKHLTGALLAAIILLTACGKKVPSYAKYISKDAGYVFAIDVQGMMGKLQKDSLTVDNVFDAFKDTSSDYAKAVSTWKDFKDAGIDFSNKLFVTVSTSGFSMQGGSTAFEMVGGLKDASKLEAFIKKQPHFTEIKKGDGFSYAGENDMMIGWNDEAVIMVDINENKIPNFNGDDSTSAIAAAPRSQSSNATAAEKLKKYFKMETNESMASVDAFKDLMGKTADISMYSSPSSSSFPAMVGVFAPKLKDLVEGAYSTSVINFEDGKADIKTNAYIGEKMANLIKQYPSNDIDMGMLDNYPSSNVDGLMMFSFNPKLIPALVREAGADATANLGLTSIGMNLDEVGSIFKGDFAFVVSDFSMTKKDMGGFSSNSPSVKLLFSAKIGNKTALDKLIAFGTKQGMIVRQGNSIMMANNGVPTPMPYAISLANDAITVASDSALMTAYLAKTQKIGLSDDIKSKLKSTSAAFYVDIEKVMTGVGTSMMDSTDMEGQKTFEKAKVTFKDAWFTAGSFDGKKSESKGELAFEDAQKNSLSQMVNFAIYAGQQQKIKSAKQAAAYKMMDSGASADSVTTPQPLK